MGEEEWNDATSREESSVKAVFLTPTIHECDALRSAWDFWNEEPATHVSYDITGLPRDPYVRRRIKWLSPDVIFYVGGTGGSGLLKIRTFKYLRTVAPLIHLCWDAGDHPWENLLHDYNVMGCFDLQVSMDGADDTPEIHLATLTPVNPEHYGGETPERDILCGFAGQNAYLGHPRFADLIELAQEMLVLHRPRMQGPYGEYVHWLRRCKIGINFSHCGSGRGHHIKIRVVEIALAGAGLLEMKAAPTPTFLPAEYMYFYDDVEDVRKLLENLDHDELLHKAAGLNHYVRKRYNAERIYRSILERVEL